MPVSPGTHTPLVPFGSVHMVGRSEGHLDQFLGRIWPSVAGKGCMPCRCVDTAFPDGMT